MISKDENQSHMNNLTDSVLTGLLLLINRLQMNGQWLGRQTLIPLAEIKLPRVAQQYDTLIEMLLEKKWIEGDAERFVLCPEGLERVQEISQEISLHTLFYNEYYQAIRHSRAHSLFCQRVYGKDLGQHGMADMDQIHELMSELEIEAGMRLLDFGCGDGQIAEYIADMTQTTVTGVDIAGQAICLAEQRTQNKRERTEFHTVDPNGRLESLSGTRFDRIWAIDSLFFAPDQPSITRRLLSFLKPGGRMGVFYICPPSVGARETIFAKTLIDTGMSFRVKDFSVQNAAHWRRKKQVLLDLEDMFRAEGNEFLFKNRLAECDGLEQFNRYLYIATVS